MRNKKNLVIAILIVTNLITATMAITYWARAQGNLEAGLDMDLDRNKGESYLAIKSWQSCLSNLNLDVDVVFLGDSITRGGNFQKYFPKEVICNLGYSGDRLTGMDRRINMVTAVKPEKIFVLGGVNDLLNHATPGVIYNRYGRLIRDLKKKVPNGEIYVQSILPINKEMKQTYLTNETIRRANEEIKRVAKENQVVFIDLYSLYAVDGAMPARLTRDGLHLRSMAYDRWAKAVSSYLH